MNISLALGTNSSTPQESQAGLQEVNCFYLGSHNSFTNYPYGIFFSFITIFFVNMPLNCNKNKNSIENKVETGSGK